MPSRQNKQNKAYVLSKKLRRRFYRGAAVTTLAYVGLSLVSFHGEFSYFPYALAIIWAVFLFCYTSFKEALRWNNASDDEIYHGELWAALLLAGATWMIVWNIVRVWIFRLPSLHFPDDYQAAVLETIVLYTLSVLSSFLYKNRKLKEQSAKKRAYTRAVHREASAIAVAAAKKQAEEIKPAQNQDLNVVLTKTSTLDKEDPSRPKSG